MKLNKMQWQLLNTVYTEPGLMRGEIIETFQSISEYTDRLRMAEIGKLERCRLIEDRASTGERSQIYLTDAGRALIEKV